MGEGEAGEHWKIEDIKGISGEEDIWGEHEPANEELQSLLVEDEIDLIASAAINVADTGGQEKALIVEEKSDGDDLRLIEDDPKMHEEHARPIQRLDKEARRALEGIFKKYDVIAWLLHDLRPPNAPAAHHFELSNCAPAQLRPPAMTKQRKEEIRAQPREKCLMRALFFLLGHLGRFL